MNTCLGIELGSTTIKAVQIDEAHAVVGSGSFSWVSSYENGVWTYDLSEAWRGINRVLAQIPQRDTIRCMGVSGMMHGYLAFDENWNLLVPFRTWQNTSTGEAAQRLTELFGFNIPQRWSVAHLYQAILNREPHIEKLAHITTLAGYIHRMLTGVNAVGIGEASGMFPIDSDALDFDAEMLQKFDALSVLPKPLKSYLPKVLTAGQKAGTLSGQGAALLDGLLPAGIPFAPPEGDAGTGMTATNAVAQGTGNVSAGTSIFSMVVLEKPLSKVYPEIDLVTTPDGKPVAMVHCNNCTNDMNAWAAVLGETAALFGAEPDAGELFTKLYEKSLEGEPDCGGITVYNYLAGEGVTHLDEGRPMVVRRPDAAFTLANFLRAQLYSTMATLRIGMDVLSGEQVPIRFLTGHGGLFKTPGVGQRYMAAACGVPVVCMETAGTGGPYGMALLAAYAVYGGGQMLDAYLRETVFGDSKSVTMEPEQKLCDGFAAYAARFLAGLPVEAAAIKTW